MKLSRAGLSKEAKERAATYVLTNARDGKAESVAAVIQKSNPSCDSVFSRTLANVRWMIRKHPLTSTAVGAGAGAAATAAGVKALEKKNEEKK